jgi:hypothetical protein
VRIAASLRFLYDRTQGEYRYASQSNDDNNEGFDVVIDPSQRGDYEVWLAWPEGAQGCNGTTAAVAFESVATPL